MTERTINSIVGDLLAEIDALRAELDLTRRTSNHHAFQAATYEQQRNDARAEIAQLKADQAELLEALEPLAYFDVRHRKHDRDDCHVFASNDTFIDLGQIRRAAELLAKHTEDTNATK